MKQRSDICKHFVSSGNTGLVGQHILKDNKQTTLNRQICSNYFIEAAEYNIPTVSSKACSEPCQVSKTELLQK